MKVRCFVCEKAKERHHFGLNSKVWINGKSVRVCNACLKRKPKIKGHYGFKLPGSKTEADREYYIKEEK